MTRLTVVAKINSYSGYGQHAIEIVRGLQRHGIYASIRSAGTQEPFGAIVPNDIKERLVRGVQPESVEIVVHTPEFFPTPGKETVFLTGYESTKLPQKTVDSLNKARVVVVPSQWNASCFSASGVGTQIRVAPLGLHPETFHYRPLPPTSPFVFGCGGRLMNGISRKGLHQIVRMFQVAFGDDRARLKIKAMPDCPIDPPKDSRIELVKTFLNDRALADWYGSIHCFVSFTTGAWELMPFQAMAVGRPVLGIKFAGMAEYLNPEASFIIPHKLVAAGDSWSGLGCWGKPEETDVINAMRTIAADQSAVSQKSWSSHNTASYFTWDRSVDAIVAILNEFNLLPRPKAHHVSTKTKCFIQLGRNGDIINILPILREEHRLGNNPVLMVSKEYRELLDGVTYAQPFIWEQDFSQLIPAIDHARAIFSDVTNTQTYGKGFAISRGESFNSDQWKLAGYLDRFNDLPLVFDRRDFHRERQLADSVMDYSLPNVVIATSGISSAFPYSKLLWDTLKKIQHVHLIDLSKVTAHRLYDLLGIFERASLLILNDSAPLHLASAVNTPLIAMVTDHPTKWHGTTPRRAATLRLKYSTVPDSIADIVGVVTGLAVKPRLLHVYQDFPGRGDSYRRNEVARKTWALSYRQDSWVNASAALTSLPREFPDDRRTLPYIKDLIDQGVLRAVSSNEIVVLTNTDTGLSQSTSETLRPMVAKHGAVFCYRRDFAELTEPLSDSEIHSGVPYMGCDLFAFTVEWWRKHGERLPDMILGGEAWDWCLRELIRATGGGQVSDLIYHERHETEWEVHRFGLPSNKHNHKLAKPFLQSLGVYSGEFDHP